MQFGMDTKPLNCFLPNRWAIGSHRRYVSIVRTTIGRCWRSVRGDTARRRCWRSVRDTAIGSALAIGSASMIEITSTIDASSWAAADAAGAPTGWPPTHSLSKGGPVWYIFSVRFRRDLGGRLLNGWRRRQAIGLLDIRSPARPAAARVRRVATRQALPRNVMNWRRCMVQP